jgi:hypothetical protein
MHLFIKAGYTLLLIILSCSVYAFSQENTLSGLPSLRNDTTKANTLIIYAKGLMYTDNKRSAEDFNNTFGLRQQPQFLGVRTWS